MPIWTNHTSTTDVLRPGNFGIGTPSLHNPDLCPSSSSKCHR